MFRWLHEHCFGTNGRVLKWTGESPKEFIQEARKWFDLNYVVWLCKPCGQLFQAVLHLMLLLATCEEVFHLSWDAVLLSKNKKGPLVLNPFTPDVFNQLPCLLLFGILVGFICIFFLEIPVTGLFIVKTIMLMERFILYLDWKRSSGWLESWEALHSPSQDCNHPGDFFSINIICYSWVHFLRESHLLI